MFLFTTAPHSKRHDFLYRCKEDPYSNNLVQHNSLLVNSFASIVDEIVVWGAGNSLQVASYQPGGH